MSTPLVRNVIAALSVLLVVATIVGCGGDSNAADQTRSSTPPAQGPSDNAFPANGTTTGPMDLASVPDMPEQVAN